jgi:probable RNA-binding protein EIF1AD
MPRPKRNLHTTAEETLTPPDSLTSTQVIARIIKAAGNNLYNAQLANNSQILVELEPKFRSTIWIKRGSYVLVDSEGLAERENKLDGVIVNVVRDERAWRKMGFWPAEFVKKSSYDQGSDDEESTVGKMPPADDEEEE